MPDRDIEPLNDHEIIKSVLVRSLTLNEGCCGTPEWRGRLCPYHQGVMDGAEMALLQLRLESKPPEADKRQS